MFFGFGDGRTVEESHKILGPYLSGKIASFEKGTANGNEVVSIIASVDPNQFYAVERFTDPTTGQVKALTSGFRWIKDLNGTIKTQSGNTITADVPLKNILDLAQLPMFLSIEGPKPLQVQVTKPSSPLVKPSVVLSFLKTEYMGLPGWSWGAISAGIIIISIGFFIKRKT